jgi:hypothetical protein
LEQTKCFKVVNSFFFLSFFQIVFLEKFTRAQTAIRLEAFRYPLQCDAIAELNPSFKAAFERGGSFENAVQVLIKMTDDRLVTSNRMARAVPLSVASNGVKTNAQLKHDLKQLSAASRESSMFLESILW